MFNNKISGLNTVYTILLILFFVACVIMFWYFLNTTFLSVLYVRVAVGITAHLGLLYTSVWLYLAKKERTLVEQFELWFKKNKK